MQRLLSRPYIAAIVLWLCCWATSVAAQTTTGSIVGVTTDPSGSLVPGAEVTIQNLGTGLMQVARTGTDGTFIVSSLPSGRYKVTVKKPGFKTLTREAVELAVDQKLRLDVMLDLGEVNETVVVQSATSTLQTESAETGHVIESRRILDLPLLGRNFLNLTSLIPGVVAGAGGNNTNTSVNGQREFANSVVVDGIEITGNRNNDNVVQPSVDAVEEFKAVTSSYAPEFGRAAGGVIAVQIKSGTNDFHGSAYEFLRTNATTARGFFAPDPSQLKQHNFGASLGGPIMRDRTFFFASYEGGRIRDVFSYLDTTVPSQMIRYLPNGSVDLSGLRDPNTGNQIPIFDPDFYNTNFDSEQFPGNIIPADRVSRAGRNILQQLFPAPNRPGLGNGWFSNYSVQQRYRLNSETGDLRLDHIRGKDRFSLTYNVADGDTFTGDRFAGAIPIDGGGSTDTGDKTHSRNDVIGLSYTRTMTPSQLNELRLSYLFTNLRQNDLLYGSNLAQRFGVGNVNISGFPQTSGFPQIFLGFGASTGGSTYKPLAFSDHNFQLSDNYSWIMGAHNFKFGYEYRHLASKPDFSAFPTGYQYYNGAFASLTSDPSYSSFYDANAYYPNGGNEIADLLLGLPGSVVLGLQSVNARTRSYENHFFVQDAWRVTGRLVLTYGFRYEYQAPYTEIRDRASNFDPGTLSVLLAGRGGNRRSLIEPDKNNFAPRLGIAWRATPKTSVRAGGGVFYSPENDGRSELLAHNFPNFIEQNFDNFSGAPFSYVLDSGNPRSTSIPVPAGARAISLTAAPNAKTQSVSMIDPHFRVGYSEMLNFTVQREITPDLTVEAGYVGAFAHKLSYQIGNMNRGNRLSNLLGIIQGQFSIGDSNYNSLQLKLDKRFARGYSVLASYTYAKGIDNGPAPFNLGPRTMQWPQDPFNLRLERAPSSTDLRHNFVLSGIWELPFARSFQGIRGAALGGWQINTILSMHTGLPVNVIRNGKAPGGFEGLRPNLLRDPNLPRDERTLTQYIDTGAFSTAGLGRTDIGNAGRNLVRGPGLVNADVSLFKQFNIKEKAAAQVRVEAFNVTNTPHFAGPNGDMSRGDFGVITGTVGNPRIMQFALKLKF